MAEPVVPTAAEFQKWGMVALDHMADVYPWAFCPREGLRHKYDYLWARTVQQFARGRICQSPEQKAVYAHV